MAAARDLAAGQRQQAGLWHALPMRSCRALPLVDLQQIKELKQLRL